jgi:hypothetical protein
MSAIDKAIQEHERIVKDSLSEADGFKRRLDTLIELKKIRHECVSEGRKPTPKERSKALSLLCWGNFAGCCAPSKQCSTHLAVCEFLRVDPEEVYAAKVRAVKKVLGAPDIGEEEEDGRRL